ncbi:MAG: hypothetical protein ACR2IE_03565 [Candidatus Sumerlaeaceae bacterium]
MQINDDQWYSRKELIRLLGEDALALISLPPNVPSFLGSDILAALNCDLPRKMKGDDDGSLNVQRQYLFDE